MWNRNPHSDIFDPCIFIPALPVGTLTPLLALLYSNCLSSSAAEPIRAQVGAHLSLIMLTLPKGITSFKRWQQTQLLSIILSFCTTKHGTAEAKTSSNAVCVWVHYINERELEDALSFFYPSSLMETIKAVFHSSLSCCSHLSYPSVLKPSFPLDLLKGRQRLKKWSRPGCGSR